MKRIFVFICLTILSVSTYAARYTNDSINVGGITGTDTVIVISKSFLNFGRTWSAEFEYTDLSHDDATIDLGIRLEILGGSFTSIGDSTFNSFGDILGVSFPVTLDATTNADSYYSKASIEIWHPDRFGGTELLIKITKGSVTSGYIRYKIIW